MRRRHPVCSNRGLSFGQQSSGSMSRKKQAEVTSQKMHMLESDNRQHAEGLCRLVI